MSEDKRPDGPHFKFGLSGLGPDDTFELSGFEILEAAAKNGGIGVMTAVPEDAEDGEPMRAIVALVGTREQVEGSLRRMGVFP